MLADNSIKKSISNEFRLISTLAMWKKKESYVAPKKNKNYTHTHTLRQCRYINQNKDSKDKRWHEESYPSLDNHMLIEWGNELQLKLSINFHSKVTNKHFETFDE